jgi:hypothetical protein
VGGTVIEDALLKLDNATRDETQMVVAETFKVVHAIPDIIEDRMKLVGQRGINSTQITVQLVVVFTIHNVFMVRCRERGRSESDGK